MASLDCGDPGDEDRQRYAVDSWIGANGEDPAVVEVEKWHIKDIDNLPKATNQPSPPDLLELGKIVKSVFNLGTISTII